MKVTNVFSIDTFSDRLKELRGERTLQEVADAIGMTRVAMGYYEKGERKPDVEMLYKIADYYQVSADYLIGLSDVKTPDIDTQTIATKTGLSEKAIERLYYFNSHTHYLEPINILLRSANFESALFHIPKYMETVKIVDILQKKRIKRYEKVESEAPCNTVDGEPVYNWPYSDNLDKNYKTKENEMIIQEYQIDRAFKYIIQELERLAKEE